MNIDRKVIERALEALNHGITEMNYRGCAIECMPLHHAAKALREALAQPQPVQQDAADAERYRFIIGHDDYGACFWHTPPGHQVPGWFMVTTKELDAAIEKAHGITKGTT